MNYYPFHLGDYATHTAHLDNLEDLAYRRLLDLYYLREAPLPSEAVEVARLIRMKDQVQSVEIVLNEFFEASTDGWRHKRCDDEIARMQDKQEKARASAQASVSARKAKAEQSQSGRSTDAERSLNGGETDRELPTPTPTPTPTPSKTVLRTVATKQKWADRPESIPVEVWDGFVAIRKSRRSPLTELALRGIEREAKTAGLSTSQAMLVCIERGWQSFSASYGGGGFGNKARAVESFETKDYGKGGNI